MAADLHPFARLTPDSVMDATESAGLRCDARILELNSYENRVYQIGIEDGEPVIGKFYRPNRWTEEQILEEHSFTLQLAEMDVSAVPPLDLGSGQTLGRFADFMFALYPRKGGRAPDLDDHDNLEILGRHIGRIHSIGAERAFKHRPSVSIDEYGHHSRAFLLEEGFIPSDLRAAYEQVTGAILGRLDGIFANSHFIRLHGDCHMGNVLWRDSAPHFVDFDDARNGPAIQDMWMMLSGDADEQSQQIARILAGYRTFADFNYAELALIEPLRTLRMMYHATWLARRWDDPAFPRAFPFFNTPYYWSQHIQELREQGTRLEQPTLRVYD